VYELKSFSFWLEQEREEMTCGSRLALREREEEIERARDGLERTESGGCGTLESGCQDREPRRWVQRNPEPKKMVAA
jgi:hypothetical protein